MPVRITTTKSERSTRSCGRAVRLPASTAPSCRRLCRRYASLQPVNQVEAGRRLALKVCGDDEPAVGRDDVADDAFGRDGARPVARKVVDEAARRVPRLAADEQEPPAVGEPGG